MDTDILAVDGDDAAPPPFEVGDPLLRRPRHQLSLEAGMSAGRLTAFVTGRGRGRALDVEPSSGTFGGLFFADGFNVWDAGAAWRLHRTLDVFGRIENIAGRDYEEALGFPALGRRATLGLRDCCGPLTSRSATATGRSSATSRSTLRTTDLSGSSGRTAPARPLYSGCWPGRVRQQRGSVTLDGVPLRTLPRALVARAHGGRPAGDAAGFRVHGARGGAHGTLPPPRSRLRSRAPPISSSRAKPFAATGTLDLESRPFSTLSGGEKQRVIIAAALAQISSTLGRGRLPSRPSKEPARQPA